MHTNHTAKSLCTNKDFSSTETQNSPDFPNCLYRFSVPGNMVIKMINTSYFTIIWNYVGQTIMVNWKWPQAKQYTCRCGCQLVPTDKICLMAPCLPATFSPNFFLSLFTPHKQLEWAWSTWSVKEPASEIISSFLACCCSCTQYLVV